MAQGDFSFGGYRFDKGGNIKGISDSRAAAKSAATIKRTGSKSVQQKFESATKSLSQVQQANVTAEMLLQEQRDADKLRQDMIIARRNRDRAAEAAAAVQLRENLARQAKIRGRAFTQSEARRFLGGGAGVRALRAGTAAERSYFKKTGVSLQQERERLRQQAELMKGVQVSRIIAETLPSQNSNKVRVRLPNGRIEEVSRTGRFNFNKSYAGQKVVVRDGQVVSVGDSKTERIPVGNFSVYSRQKQGVVSEFTGAAAVSYAINDYRDKLRMKKIRKVITPTEEVLLMAGGFLGSLADVGVGWLDLGEASIRLIRNPSQAKQAFEAFKRSSETFGQILWLSPGEGLAYIAGQYVGLKGTSAAMRSVSQVSSNVLTRLNSKFVGTAKVGKTLRVNLPGGRSVPLKVVGKIPKQSLAKQISLAGKRVTAVSTQADDLFRLLKRQKVVRKPIPGEANFNSATKNLLKKFDSGKITKTEIYQLDTMIRAQGAKGILERSFFLDPSGKVRPSRLGITKDKGLTFSDYMSSEITFKKAKPAIYIFDDLRIAKYPKKIKSIVQKMKQGKTLSPKEFTEYAQWHASPSGNAKPLGFATRESEILLSPGEILKKRGVVGYTLVNGKRVKIVRVGVYKPTGTTQKLITKLRNNKITPAERNALMKTLKKQTGLNYGRPSSATSRARYVSIKRVGYNTLSKFIKTGRKSVSPSSKRVPRKTSRRVSSSKKLSRRTSKTSKKATSRTSPRTTSKTSSPKSPTRTSRAGSSSRPRRIVKKKVISPRIQIPKGFTKKRLSKPSPAYYVIVKRRGKWVKLMAKPLTKKDARDYLAYSIDNGLERSAFFVPVGKAKVTAKLPRKMINYYGKVSNKLRPYKIRMGKKKQLLDGYIEKSKYIQDTRREKAQLSRAKAKKKVVRKAPVRRKTTINRNARAKSKTTKLVRKAGNNIRKQRAKRKLTPAQRKVLTQRLAKARRIKAQKTKRRK